MRPLSTKTHRLFRAVDSAHLAFVSRFRRLNQTMFLAVYDRDAAMSVEVIHLTQPQSYPTP